MLVLAAIFPWLGGPFYTRLAIESFLFGATALSVDILLGYAGLLSLGQAAYFGLAAYISALMYLHVTQSFWLVLVAVVTSVAVFSLVLGAVAIRAKGVYFALIKFGAAVRMRGSDQGRGDVAWRRRRHPAGPAGGQRDRHVPGIRDRQPHGKAPARPRCHFHRVRQVLARRLDRACSPPVGVAREGSAVIKVRALNKAFGGLRDADRRREIGRAHV